MSLVVDIKKSFGSFRLDVSFETGDGLLGILGASGCGKSMTLRCIAGIEKPDSGKIVLNGTTLFDSEKRINLPPQKRQIGYLFQNYALFPNMTVKQNILSGLNAIKDKTERERSCTESIRLMQLEGLERHHPAQLSGGQQQRVALARILVSKPKLLMLDEPFSALDTHLRERLQVQMKELLQQFHGVSLMVTHSRDEAYRLCERIALMAHGKFLTIKPTKQLFSDPGTISGALMTGCKNIAAAHKTGEYEVDVPEWGVRYETAQPVRDDLCAVGIRAHYFGTKTTQNRYPVVICDEVEEPFEWTIQFRYKSQAENSPSLWWRIPKDRKSQTPVTELGIAGANILLLYGQ